MTERRRARRHAASAGRILAGGISISVTGVLIAGMALDAGGATTATPPATVGPSTIDEVLPAPPAATQIIVRHHVVVPANASSSPAVSTKPTPGAAVTRSPSRDAAAPTASPSVAPATPAPEPASPTAPPPVTKSRAS